MKTLVSALALLVGSNVMAVAADQTLKFKLVAFNVGEKDGEYHFVGATVVPGRNDRDQGLLRQGGSKRQGRRTQHVLFPRRLHRDERFVRGHGNPNGRPCCRQDSRSFPEQAPIRARPGQASFEGDWGDKSPLKNAMLFNIELGVKTPGS